MTAGKYVLVGLLAAAGLGLLLGSAGVDDARAGPGSGIPYYDTDKDGCDDGLETSSNVMRGGQRDPANFWDYFDPNRDGRVSAFDFFALLGRFGAVSHSYPTPPTKEAALAEAHSQAPPPPAYHTSFDRTLIAGRSASPDGAISGIDFFALLNQFGASCVPGWQPNVVVIMTDDQDDMGSLSTMPKAQALLADQGLLFTNSFVDFPLCCPSRSSFFTGQAAHNHGVLDLYSYYKLLPTEGNMLPVWLQSAGYQTAFMGKYVNGYGQQSAVTHIPPGWTEWYGFPDPLGGPSQYYNYSINENGTIVSYGDTPADYQTDVLTSKAVDFIDRHASSTQPFFLTITPLAPHTAGKNFLFPVPAPRHDNAFDGLPLPQPPSFNEADVSDKPSFIQALPLKAPDFVIVAATSFRERRETLLAVDDMVESVVQALSASGKLQDTIIVLTSDNGFVHGEHRRTLGKGLVYEEDIRVPLLIRGPGVPADQTRSQLVNNLDLVATIVDVADANAGRILDGHSLVELVRDPGTSWRTALLVQGNNGNLPARMQAVRTPDYVYAEHRSADGLSIEYELYDLVADPYQLESQHNNPAYAGIRSSLAATLTPLKTCAGPTCWVTAPMP